MPYIRLLFSGFSNVYHSMCVWPTALKLGCITNFDMLFLVMGFISLVDEIQFMLISSHHICMRYRCMTLHLLTLTTKMKDECSLPIESCRNKCTKVQIYSPKKIWNIFTLNRREHLNLLKIYSAPNSESFVGLKSLSVPRRKGIMVSSYVHQPYNKDKDNRWQHYTEYLSGKNKIKLDVSD